ncbi:SDR family oxidoreductase [Actinocorallia sp. B10E7]|uniref:SDR family oxidoreductase n=1 Tax=Actinocorallia sp. B10E7 TaxID=3153558 RepID=UPI00325DCABC
MSRSLDGEVVVITGGARGIGAATARAVLAAGARVAVGDLDAAQAPPGCLALPLDVTDRPGFTAFLDEVERELGPLSVLVNNAGIMPVARLEDEPDQVTGAQLAINLHAVIHGSREAVRRMGERPRDGRLGHIVNVASGAGRLPVPGGATYCATKYGVVGFSEALRAEVRGAGIEVTCVLPGVVRTELAAGLTPVRGVRAVTPDEVAGAVVAALRRPRAEVYVPRSLGMALRVRDLVPRGLARRLTRAMGGESLLLDAARTSERAAYEARATRTGEQR